MRWVKETLPPRARARLELMTTRLSIRSFAGIALTLVAVGTSRLVTMLDAMALAGPRRTDTTSSSGAVGALTFFGSWAGMGWAPVPASVFLAPSRATVAGAFLAGAGWAGAAAGAGAGAAAGALAAGVADAGACAGAGGVTTGSSRVAGLASGAVTAGTPLEDGPLPLSNDSNRGHHLAS